MKTIRHFFAHPFLSLFIVFMWLVLNGFSIGQLLVAIIVGLFASFFMRLLEPKTMVIYSWSAVFLLLFRVVVDIIRSNISVIRYILFGGCDNSRSGFITITLHLKNRNALAVLACVMTASPGTAWIAYNNRTNQLLLHVLELTDEEYWHNLIKDRYETLLIKIFR